MRDSVKNKKPNHIMYIRFLSILVASRARELGFTWSEEEKAHNVPHIVVFRGGGKWFQRKSKKGEEEEGEEEEEEKESEQEIIGLTKRMLRIIPENSRILRKYKEEIMSGEPQTHTQSPSASMSQTSRFQGHPISQQGSIERTFTEAGGETQGEEGAEKHEENVLDDILGTKEGLQLRKGYRKVITSSETSDE